jgi:group II intron reverse transcriptase/maturase
MKVFVMNTERRNGIALSETDNQLDNRRSYPTLAKPFEISKRQVFEAYKEVKANKGGAGIDGQTLTEFDQNLGNNLYRLWTRLASGSYFPPAVKRVNIPKGNGGLRPLGIPTVTDRIAQTVVKQSMQLSLERCFHRDSYAYQPYKSAHMALDVVKHRNWKRPWVLELDIKGFFDAIDHTLMLKAVDRHVSEPWQKLYIERWLTAAVLHPGGQLEQRTKGTPQGGVISPLLANLFLHYVFDSWVEKHWHQVQFVRYADDIICHCRS